MLTHTSNAVLNALVRRPSLASAAAIGRHYVLQNVPAAIRLQAMDGLGSMICDWSLEILEQAARCDGPQIIRLHAVHRIRAMLVAAISHGYRPVTRSGAGISFRGIERRPTIGAQTLTELTFNVRRALKEGYFTKLADF